jgi:alkyl hydroperoxide reductase subunit F
MSAAIYATRKNLDVAVLGDRIGGQITNTASIENWLGIPSISGQELATLFRSHAERYPVAERLHVKVRRIEGEQGGFVVLGEDGTRYRASAVIYCTGKEYRRLGVPGERRFLGRGIAFCATCDAPLYRDKRVAVIGGGNSAFTAARDLLGYAREIHIVNILDDFQADPALFEQVTKADRVSLHPATRVKEFLGQEQLSGVRLEAVDGSHREDLAVEGVFLEIGLVPNSAPVGGLLELNGLGEIPVQRDQSSAVPGLFAAGDVTDETEKQIVVAAGAGAKAALAAHRYLSENGWVAAPANDADTD